MHKKKEKQYPAISHGIALKKQYGQHFLRDYSVINSMLSRVTLTQSSSVFEIGCGDGFLTTAIMQTKIARLWVFEIDPDWAGLISERFKNDPRLKMNLENILDVDFTRFDEFKPWTLLANLPYSITFPILHLLQKNRQYLAEGVVMVQEEVAQKIVKKSGRGYGYPSLFFQHYFDWELLVKIKPEAFFPPPKVDSRLLYFKPKQQVTEIPDEKNFWKFIKLCFLQPRRTLRNNLASTHFSLDAIPEDILQLRAQEMNMAQLLSVWESIRSTATDFEY